MQTEQLTWHYDGTTIELGADWSGQGPLVLLLPALSSISTRREMGPLQERLSTNYQTISIDWPGFGNRPRAHRDWRPKNLFRLPNLSHRLDLTTGPCRDCGRPRGDVCPSSLLHSSGNIQTTRSYSPDLAWTTADHNGRSTAVVRPHMPASGSANYRAAALPTKRESACRSLHGRRTRLYRSCLAARRTIA